MLCQSILNNVPQIMRNFVSQSTTADGFVVHVNIVSLFCSLCSSRSKGQADYMLSVSRHIPVASRKSLPPSDMQLLVSTNSVELTHWSIIATNFVFAIRHPNKVTDCCRLHYSGCYLVSIAHYRKKNNVYSDPSI